MEQKIPSAIHNLFFSETHQHKLIFIDATIQEMKEGEAKDPGHVVMLLGGEIGTGNCTNMESIGLIEEVLKEKRWQYLKKVAKNLDIEQGKPSIRSHDGEYTWMIQDFRSSTEVIGWIEANKDVWIHRLKELKENKKGKCGELD